MANSAVSKFRMKVKLQGFELEIEGNRQDASIIGRNIGEQISAMLSPAVNIVEGETIGENHPTVQPIIALPESTPKRKSNRRPKAPSGEASVENGASIEFRHDPAKYGMPSQQWNTAQKAIWLLYVVRESVGVGEMSAGQIFRTFNTQFRQAKTITRSNVFRDLGKAKLASPALVGEDTTKTPALWFLTDEGVRRAQTLVAESLAPKKAA